ncbi:hypothetical protein FOMG_19455 [Fusarium oxysporum f. sp. melonis 26406]|uniref:Uncharacterized protein n=1 Tax=Fusarium oxysporum f. sp. melonis 26406 TaxID=1089452 RepID=W9YX76_FUSOX|nr:hypothetical protein FOMG_19455 [Fusarium oxysporum f. sp. melonis 26406]
MKFLTVLAIVSTALALVPKPIPYGTGQGATDSSLEHVPRNDVENVDVNSVKLVRSDVAAPDGGPKKRSNIPIPNEPNPKSVLIGGVAVSFTMVGKWIRQGGGSVFRYVCKRIDFNNSSGVNKFVTLVANGATVYKNQPINERKIVAYIAPEGGITNGIDVVIANHN